MNIYDLINEDDTKNIDIINNKDQEQNQDQNQQDNMCLITNKPLDENYITLDCNHKFNYMSIFNEVKNQKFTKNYYDTNRPLFHQIKCPYCRTTTSKL